MNAFTTNLFRKLFSFVFQDLDALCTCLLLTISTTIIDMFRNFQSFTRRMKRSVKEDMWSDVSVHACEKRVYRTGDIRMKYLLSTISSVLVLVLAKFRSTRPRASVVGINCERAAIEGEDVDMDLN